MASSQRAMGRQRAGITSDRVGSTASSSGGSSSAPPRLHAAEQQVQPAPSSRADPSSLAQQRYESELHKEQLRQQVRETIARIQKLTQEHHAVTARNDSVRRVRERETAPSPAGHRSREATPEYDPDNPFDDRTMADQARAAAERAAKAAAAIPSSRAARSTQSSRRPSQMNKSPSEGDILHKGSSDSNPAAHVPRTSVPSDSTPVVEENAPPASAMPARRRALVANADASTRPRNTASTLREQPIRTGRNGYTSPIRDAKPGSSKRVVNPTLNPSVASTVKQSPPNPRRKAQTDRITNPIIKSDAPRRSLSDEASTTLASLDATLARLKSLSPRPSREERPKGADDMVARRESGEKDTGSGVRRIDDRMRRSLSPSKELYEKDVLRLKSAAEEPAVPRQTKSSFLARVEQTRQTSPERTRESVTSKPRVQHQDASSSTELTAWAEVQTQTQSKKIAQRKTIYAYTPPKRIDKEQQCCAGDTSIGLENSSIDGIGNASGSSIMIGEESVDDLMRSHGTQEDGRVRQFLQGFTVLVDVRDQDGEDASTVWSEKLRGVGAKVYAKPPQPSRRRSSGGQNAKVTTNAGEDNVAPALDCIVYKHGKPATLHYYRAQIDAGREPIIVGVNWILECLRKGARVDGRDFLVEVGKHPVFAKRRTSMTPKRAPMPSETSTDALSSEGPRFSELLARKKLIQNAPGKPSPLATRCWNMNASTSSTMSTVTANHTHTTISALSNVSHPSFS